MAVRKPAVILDSGGCIVAVLKDGTDASTVYIPQTTLADLVKHMRGEETKIERITATYEREDRGAKVYMVTDGEEFLCERSAEDGDGEGRDNPRRESNDD